MNRKYTYIHTHIEIKCKKKKSEKFIKTASQSHRTQALVGSLYLWVALTAEEHVRWDCFSIGKLLLCFAGLWDWHRHLRLPSAGQPETHCVTGSENGPQIKSLSTASGRYSTNLSPIGWMLEMVTSLSLGSSFSRAQEENDDPPSLSHREPKLSPDVKGLSLYLRSQWLIQITHMQTHTFTNAVWNKHTWAVRRRSRAHQTCPA